MKMNHLTRSKILQMIVNPHIETTSQIWPNNLELKDYLSFPLSLSLQPLVHDQPLALTPPDQINLYRCQSCKAFINQLCFIRNEQEYDCSICGCTNYVQSKIDISMPELNNLSYKIKAPQSQRILKTEGRLFIFILDLSNYQQQSKEYLIYSIHVIREFIKAAALSQLSMNVMILGFDSGVIRFVVNPSEGNFVEKIVTTSCDVEDSEYFPNNEQLFGNLSQIRQNIDTILNDIEESVLQKHLRAGNSKALLQALTLAMKIGEGYSGKIFLVSGLRHELEHFYNHLKPYTLDLNQKHSFMANKKAIPSHLDKLIQTSQLSLAAFFINNQYMNNMPFHCMTKMLNGQLRQFFPSQTTLFFHQFRQALEEILHQNTVFESLMRVRYSTGLKMVGMFGSYRPTKITDQVDLVTCPFSRRYMFQFLIQGKINSQFVVIQFSTLCTALNGQRYFLIQTHWNKVSLNIEQIISNIDYASINIAYVRGIVHNLDLSFKNRNLQLVLQERCKRHIQAIRQTIKASKIVPSERIFDDQLLKKAKPYVIVTFLMMKHFLLNQNYPSILSFDLNAVLRSKVACKQNFINIIWPIVYAVNEENWQIIDMVQNSLPKATVAIFIDRCDQQYVYLREKEFQSQLRTASAKQILHRLIQNEEKLQPLKQLIEEFKEKKELDYIDILPLEDISELKVLDLDSKFGFDKFIKELVSNNK